MQIRDARIDEVKEIVGLIRNTLPTVVKGLTPYDCSGIDNYVRDNVMVADCGNEIRYLVATAAGAIVGAIETQLTPTDIFIKYVAVAPGSRRRGIGNQLLAATLAAFSDKLNLSLHVLESNAAALTWYEGLGMKKISSVDWHTGDLEKTTNARLALVGGYAQMASHFERFGFGTVTLKNALRTSTIGVLSETWLRFGSWEDVQSADFVASLHRLWPERRALVIESAPCPPELQPKFQIMARAHLMKAPTKQVAQAIAERRS